MRIRPAVSGEPVRMIKWLKRRRLEKLHRKLLEEARDLQRRGDIVAFAAKTAEADKVERELASLA